MNANFKVVEGTSYSILFGLDLFVPLNAKIYLKERVLEVAGPGPSLDSSQARKTFCINLLPRSTVWV